MIKAIIFDFGNVICSFDRNIFFMEISRNAKKSLSEVKEAINSSELQEKYEAGWISSGEFFRGISAVCGLNMSKEEFIRIYNNIFTPIKETYKLIKNLKPKYKLGLLSNTNEWHFEYSIKNIKVFDLFDTVTLSYKVKAMKPDRRIFMDALAKLGLKPEECVYIDDIEEYVEAAKNLEINGIQYQKHEKLIKELKKLGVVF